MGLTPSCQWLTLDSDSESCLEPEQSTCSMDQTTEAAPCTQKAPDSVTGSLPRRGNRLSFWDSCSVFEKAYGHTRTASESDTRTEMSETSEDKLLELDEAWPLPPHRTIVVDESSEEGWHDVESIVEVCAYNHVY